MNPSVASKTISQTHQRRVSEEQVYASLSQETMVQMLTIFQRRRRKLQQCNTWKRDKCRRQRRCPGEIEAGRKGGRLRCNRDDEWRAVPLVWPALGLFCAGQPTVSYARQAFTPDDSSHAWSSRLQPGSIRPGDRPSREGTSR